jgi:hypothetical protein
MLVHATSDPIENTHEIGRNREEKMERKTRTRMRRRTRSGGYRERMNWREGDK